MTIRAVPLPFDTAVPALSSSAGLRRAALWGLLVSYAAERGGRLLATIVFGAMLYGTLHLVVDPSNLVAYRRGGVFFYTLAILSALIIPSALVTTARVARTRWAPVLVLLVIIPMGIVGGKIAQLGFAWLQPVSVIEEEIATDSQSPIALAHTR